MHPLTVQPRQRPPGPLAAPLLGLGLPAPVVVYAWNPLSPAERQVTTARAGQSLAELRPDTQLPTLCILNGEPVLAADWELVDLECGDHAVFMMLPHGGDGGSNPLTAILAIVVIAVGIYTGNVGLIAGGAAMLAVGLLPQPTYAPISNPSASYEQSPTYSIQLGGNSARLGQAIPVPYGYHIISPDFASQPYSEFDDDGDQFYHALLCLGLMDEFTLVNTFIDDTPLAHFVEVETQLVGPNFAAPLSLVNPCVVNAPEVAQQDLLYGSVVGPFAASGPGLSCTKIGIDVLCPKGLYFAESDGTLGTKSISWMVEARKLTDAGAVAGIWTLLGSETLTLAEGKPVRRTYTYTVPAGRYQVRMQRTSARDDNNRAAHDIQWLGMRAYINTVAALDPDASYLALKIRATSQLSGLSQRRISCIVQRWLPTWNPTTGWSAAVATSSIAWALADALKNPVYGGGLEDNRIDLQTLYDLDALWASRSDTFNGLFDRRVTIWNALTTIARAGRARPVMRGSVFTFVRDSEQELPVALFNMRNIQRGSFSLDYTLWTEDSADGVELEFFNAATWASDYVVMPMPGEVDAPINPARMSIVGITGIKQAQREAAYYVAEAAYRRSMVSFTTELEGHLPGYGDLIAVAHDVADWGSSGEIIAWNGVVATCSEDLTWGSGTFYALLVNSQGDPLGPYRVAEGTAPRTMRFLDAPEEIYTGTERERTRYSMGLSSAYAVMCRVVNITPTDNDLVQIRALVEDERVHTADLPYAGPDTGGGGGGGGGGVTGRLARYAPDGVPTYDETSDEQRNAYGFFSDIDRTVGTADDEGYVYDN